MRSGRSPKMLTFLTPETCKSSWRSDSASRVRTRKGISWPLRAYTANTTSVYSSFRTGGKHAFGKFGGLVLNFLAALIELFFDLVGRRIVPQRDGQKCQARTGERVHVVVVFEFLETFFERLRHQILHLLCGRSRPCSRDREYFDRRTLDPRPDRE